MIYTHMLWSSKGYDQKYVKVCLFKYWHESVDIFLHSLYLGMGCLSVTAVKAMGIRSGKELPHLQVTQPSHESYWKLLDDYILLVLV